MKKISCVIMDWAGTAVDFGCFAPLNAFLKVFSEEKGIDITYRQAREPMGLLKIDHIKAILNMPEVNDKFRARYGRDWNMDDVNEMYQSFEKHLFASLKNFTTPIPGVLDTIRRTEDWFDNRLYASYDGRGSSGCRCKRLCGGQPGDSR